MTGLLVAYVIAIAALAFACGWRLGCLHTTRAFRDALRTHHTTG